MSRVLLVDDDALLTRLLTEYLTAGDLNIHSVPDDEASVHETLTGQYDVVVLDSAMPKMSGLDILKNVRSQGIVPVIMPTAEDDDINHVIGLGMGADDCVPKPCTPYELLARINAILCRAQRGGEQDSAPNDISVNDIVLYPAKRQITIREEPPELTSTELNLLEVLVHRARQVVSREILFVEALGRGLTKFDRSIDVHTSSIRHKLSDASLIQTVRSLDYLFVKN